MKKIIRGIGKFFRHIGAFFDKWLITPITKLILKIIDFWIAPRMEQTTWTNPTF